MHAEDTTAEAVLAAYANGQRLFSQLALPDGSDLSGCCLEGASFHECFLTDINLKGVNLRGANFRRCNLKCSDFDDSDLMDAVIEECSIECLSAHRCKIKGLQVRNCGCHSSTDLGLEEFIELAVNFPDS